MLESAVRGLASRLAYEGARGALSETFTFTTIKKTRDELGVPGQGRIQDWAKVQDDMLFLSTQTCRAVGDHMHQTFVWVRAKLLDHFLQVPIVSRAEVLRGVLNLGKLLEESSGGVVSARPPRGAVPALCSACHSRTAFMRLRAMGASSGNLKTMET